MTTTQLRGDDLLIHCSIHHRKTRAEIARLAGYTRPDNPDKISFTAFYENLMQAGAGGAMDYETWHNIATCARMRSCEALDNGDEDRALREHLSARSANALALANDAQPYCLTWGCPDFGVYFACLASYNNGRLYGCWVDLEKVESGDCIRDAIAYMLRRSPTPGAEEWRADDYSDVPRLLIQEWPDLDRLAEYATAKNDAQEPGAFDAWVGNVGIDADFAGFGSAFLGIYDREELYAMERAEEIHGEDVFSGDNWPFCCIDWEAAWRYLNHQGFYSEPAPGYRRYIFAPV